jgi:hypothetical protein
MRSKLQLFAIALLLSAFFSSGASAEPWESPHPIPTSSVLPADQLAGDGYTLGPEVEADGFSQRYVIRSDEFGEFHPVSDYMLGVRLLELRALGVLAQMGTSKTFAKALGTAGKAPLVVAKGLVTRPVETVSAVPKGIYRGAKKAANWIGGDRRERADTEAGATKEAIGFSRRKRELAGRLDVNPYSSNMRLQDELDRIAWASFSGGISLSVAFSAVGVPPVANMTYKVARLQKTTSELVTSVSGGDLHRRNRDLLVAEGLDAEAVENFLNNPNLSPYHKTAITEALRALGGVGGRAEAIALGIEVEDSVGAVRLQRTVELIAGYHERVAPVAALRRVSNTLALRTKSGVVAATLPADRLLWTPETADLVAALQAAKSSVPIRAHEIWITGVFSDNTRAGLRAAGVKATERAGERIEGTDAEPATPAS